MSLRNLRVVLTIFCAMGQLLVPLHTQSLRAEETGSTSAANGPVAQQAEETKGVDGVAAYYAKRYNGKRTNSGDRYNPAELTAAHPSLPHGTRVRVINLTNNKEVTVTINDRCRARKQPFIDLSRAAAKQLGFLGKGTARVRIIALNGQPG